MIHHRSQSYINQEPHFLEHCKPSDMHLFSRYLKFSCQKSWRENFTVFFNFLEIVLTNAPSDSKIPMIFSAKIHNFQYCEMRLLILPLDAGR